MKYPENGSSVANTCLVFTGILLGTIVGWWLASNGEPLALSSPKLPTHKSPQPLSPRVEKREHFQNQTAISQFESLFGTARAEGFRNAGAVAASKDLKSSLAEAESISSRQDQMEFYRGIYGVWASLDPVAALDFAQANFTAGQLLSDTVGIAMNKWANENPREAWIWADQHLSGPLKDRALTDLVIGWSRRSPEQAATWLKGTGLTSQPLFHAIASTWAETNPGAAAKWARTLQPGHVSETALVAIAGTLAANDPKAAAGLFSEELSQPENLNLAITIADIWATTDPAAAATWLESLPEGATKTEAAATLATVWAASDINAAVAWSASITDNDTRRQVIAHIGTTWGAIEPEAALQWLGALPAAQATDGITGALYSWAGTDPVGMQIWIAQASTSHLGDRARQSLGDVLTQTRQSDAMALALGMNSEISRNETLTRYFRDWRKSNDEAAQDWLQVNWATLPATAQKQLASEQAKAVIKR